MKLSRVFPQQEARAVGQCWGAGSRDREVMEGLELVELWGHCKNFRFIIHKVENHCLI